MCFRSYTFKGDISTYFVAQLRLGVENLKVSGHVYKIIIDQKVILNVSFSDFHKGYVVGKNVYYLVSTPFTLYYIDAMRTLRIIGSLTLLKIFA